MPIDPKTQDALDALATLAMAPKVEALTRLSPVGTERGSLLPRSVPAPFPNDNPVEVIEDAVKTIRREVRYIIEALDNIDATNGVPPAVVLTTEDVPTKEQMADAQARLARALDEAQIDAAIAMVKNFPEDFEAKSVAAQAATYRSTNEPVPLPVEHWVCPEHGDGIPAKTRKGRDSFKCPLCGRWAQ